MRAILRPLEFLIFELLHIRQSIFGLKLKIVMVFFGRSGLRFIITFRIDLCSQQQCLWPFLRIEIHNLELKLWNFTCKTIYLRIRAKSLIILWKNRFVLWNFTSNMDISLFLYCKPIQESVTLVVHVSLIAYQHWIVLSGNPYHDYQSLLASMALLFITAVRKTPFYTYSHKKQNA